MSTEQCIQGATSPASEEKLGQRRAQITARAEALEEAQRHHDQHMNESVLLCDYEHGTHLSNYRLLGAQRLLPKSLLPKSLLPKSLLPKSLLPKSLLLKNLLLTRHDVEIHKPARPQAYVH